MARSSGDGDEAPVFDQFNLVVADMAATVAFYRRLGLEIPETDEVWSSHHRNAVMPDGVALDFDSVDFAKRWDEQWRPGMGVLGFKVPSREAVDRTHDDLTSAGYVSQLPPHDAFWGSRYAIVEDPDGNPVGIMSPRDPDRQAEAPTP